MTTARTAARLPRLLSRRLCHRAYSQAAARGGNEVRIVEVGPRDGLQNEKKTVPVATKIELVDRLSATGLKTIEAGSFVSPKWVPQMANSSEILSHLLDYPPKSSEPLTYQWLLPNTQGLDNFLSTYSSHPSNFTKTDKPPALNTSSQDPNSMPSTSPSSTSSSLLSPHKHEISIFTAATETFTQKNTNCSIAESLERFKSIFATAKELSLPIRAYISVALGCPYEGPNVSPHAVADLAVSLLEMGADEISVADTTGQGTAPRTAELLKTLAAAGVDVADLALHFHDTWGMALVNMIVGLEHGVRTFDAAVAGLGGCPFSPGATGNVASEDVVYLCESLGLKTGVDLAALAGVGEWISEELGRENESRAGKATMAKLRGGKGVGG
ncbi:aldolase [Patellaria atrata CBS 101060]|uniref:hydroxymethylglutaryl-CoA lyase n=1 Tax=Patellaria atrata CBS 101060 TaxID=1346257 RepID=A0A9P4VSC5_9PEZI|nr:aldolase [Patellaria atrata CBS 101060]